MNPYYGSHYPTCSCDKGTPTGIRFMRSPDGTLGDKVELRDIRYGLCPVEEREMEDGSLAVYLRVIKMEGFHECT